jgi:hypothetical protein
MTINKSKGKSGHQTLASSMGGDSSKAESAGQRQEGAIDFSHQPGRD